MNGFTTYARAPASLARSTSSFWLKAVSSTTGAMWFLLSFSAAEMPSSCGILTSMITRSGTQLGGERDGGLAVACLTDDVEAVVAEDLDDVEADERLILRDDDATGGGCSETQWPALAQSPLNPTVWSFADVPGRCGGMADATDSKSVARKGVWVRVPPPVRRGHPQGWPHSR